MRKTIQVGNNSIQVDKIVFWSYYQNDDGDNCVELQTSTGRYFYFVGSMHDKFIEEINKIDTKEYIVVTASYANDFERAVNKKLSLMFYHCLV